MLVLLPALNAVELFDIFGFVLGDSNAVPMIPLLAVVTTSEIRLVIIRILIYWIGVFYSHHESADIRAPTDAIEGLSNIFLL